MSKKYDEYLENEAPETDCCKWSYGVFNNKKMIFYSIEREVKGND